ncbi:MAG: endonuclease V [Chitinivibrionia bacterium]|nr:endonuclease V [Chitinivibrionia bacterium]
MKINNIHRWDVSIQEAIELQRRLRERIRLRPLAIKNIAHVAGADIAVDTAEKLCVGAVVVLGFPGLEVVEMRHAQAPMRFPYVPGLLSFREIPVLLDVLKKVETPFEALLCDGQGIAHPRGIGLASHLGLFLGIPTIGCAKNRLIGEFEAPGEEKGSFSALTSGGARIGSVVRTRTGVKPIFVSPGHLVDHASSRRIVLACTKRFRIPEPTRRAHILAGGKKPAGEQPPAS